MSNRKYTDKEIDDIIKNCPEQLKIDFKEDLILSNNYKKEEFIKDIIAIANVPEDYKGYIFYGIEDKTKNIKGIQNHYDDASLQQIVNSKVLDNIKFIYFPQEYRGKEIAICEISEFQKRPLMPRENFELLKKGVVYIRRGSGTDTANPEEITKMIELTKLQEERIKFKEIDLKTEIRKKILMGEKLSKVIGEYYDFLISLPDSEWIKYEITTFPEGSSNFKYRIVNGYISIGELITPGNYTLDEIGRSSRDLIDFSLLITQPLYEIERWVEDFKKLHKNAFQKIRIKKDLLIRQGFFKAKDLKSIEYFYFYCNQHQSIYILERIKSKLLGMIE